MRWRSSISVLNAFFQGAYSRWSFPLNLGLAVFKACLNALFCCRRVVVCSFCGGVVDPGSTASRSCMWAENGGLYRFRAGRSSPEVLVLISFA